MLVRIVHMEFQPEHVADFRNLFEHAAPQIRAFPGCQHLELWQRADASPHFTTYSLWNDEASLDSYRTSPLFLSTWSQTRQWFSAAPRALSFHRHMRL